MRIPLDQIDATGLPRDRTLIDAAALAELERSIAATGLRTPIEVYAVGTGYGLISGLRRLTAFRRLYATTQLQKFDAIEATLRTPLGPTQAMAMMVEENEVRANLSPWERSAIATRAVGFDGIETLDAAITTLFPHADRNKRHRIQVIAEVVEDFDTILIDPEGLSQNQLERIAAANRLGWGQIIETALSDGTAKDHRAQWQVLKPILTEFEGLNETTRRRPNSPVRLREFQLKGRRVSLRRERTKMGYIVHISGHGASDPLIGEVIDNIEHMLTDG